MDLIEYSMPDDVKKQLGYIIREERKRKFQEVKNQYLIENNPFTKENFCENNEICHYHTLTKLENEFIKEDYVYHILLKKLGLYYQVKEEEHNKNMNFINELSKDLLYAGEYIDDDMVRKVKEKVESVKFDNDCIASLYLDLIELFYSLQLLIKVDENKIELLGKYIDFFEGVHIGLLNQCLGIYHLNKLEPDTAKDYFLNAQKIYADINISKGLISSYLIAVYVITYKYYESYPLCLEMEQYYLKTHNRKRLMHVYNYLSDYYLLIYAYDIAKDYFKKAIEIIDQEPSLERFKYSLYFNWGYRCFMDFKYEEALDHFKLGYVSCKNNPAKFQFINLILIVMTSLHCDQNEINFYYQEGEKFFDFGNEYYQNLFRYFRFKLQNNKYYRRYAYDKLIPSLQNKASDKEILLFFYEDLYKS